MGATVIYVIFDWVGVVWVGISWVCVCGSVGKQHQYPWKMGQNHNKEYICLGHNPGGGGGYSGYILVGVSPGTPKKGGGSWVKRGGLRCGHSPKKGGS